MIDLYFGPTPNAGKVTIMLEEVSAPYAIRKIDILEGDQFKPEFLAISPNNKMPAIVDNDGPDGEPIAVWESGAILLFLAEKYGRFVPGAPRGRIETLKWLMFQMAGLGPMSGQFAFFNFYCPEKIPLAMDRYRKEVSRQMRVMDEHLTRSEYFAGSEYSVADMAIYPWWEMLRSHFEEDRPALDRWGKQVAERPAVERGMSMLHETLRPEFIQAGMSAQMSKKTYSLLYGERQHSPSLQE